MTPFKQPASTLGSKWTKTKMLLENRELSRYVPDTAMYSYADLFAMLNKHKMVYIKPDKGSGGKGVIKVQKRKDKSYLFHKNSYKRTFKSYAGLFAALEKAKLGKPYMIQQGIRLLKYQGKITDLRIVLQQNEKSQWEHTGMIGRVSHPRKIVTNFHADGKALPVHKILKPYLRSRQTRLDFIEQLKELSLKVADELTKDGGGFKDLGLDIGLDASLKPWILEVNTRPNSIIFDQLKDKSMYRRMLQLQELHTPSDRPVYPFKLPVAGPPFRLSRRRLSKPLLQPTAKFSRK